MSLLILEGISVETIHIHIEECFHLTGICVEAMCSPTSIQPLDTVVLCLKSIYVLLDDAWPRSRIGTDQSLAIELLNVLHRYVHLSCDKGLSKCNVMILRKYTEMRLGMNKNIIRAEINGSLLQVSLFRLYKWLGLKN